MHGRIADLEIARSHAFDVEQSASSVPEAIVADHPFDQTLPLVPARGILVALVIAAPFWALIALALYLIF